MHNLYKTDDLWARRNPNRIKKGAAGYEGMASSKLLCLRILSWAENAKTDKTGQDHVHSDHFKEDLHQAVIYDNYEHNRTGISKVEKKEMNWLWKKYSIYGRLESPRFVIPQATLDKIRDTWFGVNGEINRKIEAIKWYRNWCHKELGCPIKLKQAKDDVDLWWKEWKKK